MDAQKGAAQYANKRVPRVKPFKKPEPTADEQIKAMANILNQNIQSVHLPLHILLHLATALYASGARMKGREG